MRKDIIIRRETEDDRPRVEEIVRRAFYNLYIPGAAEHYLVHIMRSHPDFIQELDLVLELEGQVIGAIMYTRAHLVDERGEEHLWSGMRSAGVSAHGVRKDADGGILPKGGGDGLRHHCNLRRTGQLCEPGL